MAHSADFAGAVDAGVVADEAVHRCHSASQPVMFGFPHRQADRLRVFLNCIGLWMDMKVRSMILAAALSVATASGLVVGTSPASGATPSSYMDFEASPISDQCSLPVESRTGNWTCGDPAHPTTPAEAAAAEAAAAAAAGPSSLLAIGSSVPRSEHCNGWGCWSVFNDFFAEFYTTSVYDGYGGQTVGNLHFLVEWHNTGAQVAAGPVQSTYSAYTVNTVFSGALSNGAHNVVGSEISSCSPQTVGAAAANQTVTYSKGCRLPPDYNNWDHNMAIESSRTLSQYPGTWWFFAKSPVSHTTDKVNWRFSTADILPGDSARGGWNG